MYVAQFKISGEKESDGSDHSCACPCASACVSVCVSVHVVCSRMAYK